MDPVEFERVAESFARFHAEFAPLFGRSEARERSEQYLRGLLVQQTDRRNAENLAEVIAGATPRASMRRVSPISTGRLNRTARRRIFIGSPPTCRTISWVIRIACTRSSSTC